MLASANCGLASFGLAKCGARELGDGQIVCWCVLRGLAWVVLAIVVLVSAVLARVCVATVALEFVVVAA